VGHVGLSNPGTISHNQIIFNQSFFQAQNTSGGGIVIEGEPSSLGGLSIGTGNVTVDANLIQGNHAGGGHGGGIRLQNVNGADVGFGNGNGLWQVQITNNMIVDNVAGFSGGGLSLSDVSRSSIFNNTIQNNDSTATAGAVFTTSRTQSSFQPAGISSELHSPGLAAATGQEYSDPTLANNIVWHNRSFYFQAGQTNTTTGATPTVLVPTLTSQPGYACPSGAHYWDLGVLGQSQASPTLRLHPVRSILTDTTGYGNTNTSTFGPASVVREYCNGPRVNPGAPDTTPSAPPMQFGMQPAAAEDEGGNWIELRYGPLSLSDSSISAGSAGYGVLVGDYHLSSTSEAINKIACNQSQNTRTDHDFDGLLRPVPACTQNAQTNYDIGADEYGNSQGVGVSPLQVSPTSWSPSLTGASPATVRTQVITITNPNATAVNITTQFVPTGTTTQQQLSTVFGVVPFSSTCSGNSVPASGSCQITIRFGPTFLVASGTYTGLFQVNGDPNSSVSLTGKR